MKRTVTAVGILAALVCVAILFHIRLNRDIAHLEAGNRALQEAAWIQDWPAAIACSEAMSDDWQRISPFYSLFIDQALLDVTEGLLNRAFAAAHSHNQNELHLTCASISTAMQNILRNESLHWSVTF